MAKIKTTRFGEIEIQDKDILNLPNGVIGFSDLRSYALLDHDKDSPFKWLQSLDDGSIAFVVMNPLHFKPDYVVEIADNEVADLEIASESDVVVSVVITMPSDPSKMTANLKAPILFNLKNRRGKQIILNHPDYTTRHCVMDEMRRFHEYYRTENNLSPIDMPLEMHGASVSISEDKA